MLRLSKNNLTQISDQSVCKPPAGLFNLPERILQFGTGVLLRGLPDYLVDKANRNSFFNGRIVVVKSTAAGDVGAFADQDNLYTLCIRGIDKGVDVAENVICSAISRVLIAKNDWEQIRPAFDAILAGVRFQSNSKA